MGGIQSYRDLIVWQKSIDFVEAVYRATETWPKHEIYGLTSQLRRAAVSIPSNIAEDQARQHTKEFKQFIHISLGSLAEAHTQVLIAKRLSYVSQAQAELLERQIVELQKMLRSLSKRLRA